MVMFGMSNSKATRQERAETARGFVRDVLPLYNASKVRPVVDRVFAFHELQAAKAHMESNANVGKVVVEIGSAA
jgi:NADPH:quinone reductase-like Zn-dependent oxidoreductase